MNQKKGRYSNIVAIAREDAREYRIVNGKNSDVFSERWYYRFAAFLKVAAFAVFAAMSISFVFGAINDLVETPHTPVGVAELKYAIILVSVSLFFITGGFIMTCLKTEKESTPLVKLIGSIIVMVFCLCVAFFLLYAALTGENSNDGALTRHIWRFVVPGCALAFSAFLQSFMAWLEKRGDVKRYNMVLDEAYAKFTEGKDGVTYTEEEWEAFVSSYKRKPKSYSTKKNKK